MGHLVLTRRRDESIRIGSDVKVGVTEIRSDSVRLSIDAPRSVSVLRDELEPLAPVYDLPATNGTYWLRVTSVADWQIVRFRNSVIRWFHSTSDMTIEDLAIEYPNAQWGHEILPPGTRPGGSRDLAKGGS